MNLLTTDESITYGAFRVGNMALALPMSVLREVVPLADIRPLPSMAKWVIGGLDLRGVLVPVVDLSSMNGQPVVQGEECNCVIMVACEGRLLGLLASAVDCLFTAEPSQVKEFHSSEPVTRVAKGSVHNPFSGCVHTVLCAESLLQLPFVCSVSDPEPHRQALMQKQEDAAAEEAVRMPLLLMKSGDLLFAVNPSHIETTMPRAHVVDNDLCEGYYKGNTMYRDCEIPAVCLLEYLQMESGRKGFSMQARTHETPQARPAFILRYEAGAVAVLIDEVLDIVRIDPGQMISLPPVPELTPHVLQQTLPVKSVYPGCQNEDHYYVIHPSGLLADARLQELAGLLHRASLQKQAGDVLQAGSGDLQGRNDRRMIVFDMHGDHAIPIEQIAEVLHYRGVSDAFPTSIPFRGVITHRGCAIPVVDLAQHIGLPRQHLDSKSSSVLVVKVDGSHQVGFAVGCLRSIEQAQWSPSVPVLGAERTTRFGAERSSQQLVEVHMQGEKKLLEVIQAGDEARRYLQSTLQVQEQDSGSLLTTEPGETHKPAAEPAADTIAQLAAV